MLHVSPSLRTSHGFDILSEVRAFTKINISGLLVLGTVTSMPALPFLFKIFISLIGQIVAQNSICMCHGSGAISSLFLLVIGCVVAVGTHRCRSRIASVPTPANPGEASDGTAQCASWRRARVGRSSEHNSTAEPCAPAWWTTRNVSWPNGGHTCSRETRKMGRQRKSVAKLELRCVSLRGSNPSRTVDGQDRCRDQHGCDE